LKSFQLSLARIVIVISISPPVFLMDLMEAPGLFCSQFVVRLIRASESLSPCFIEEIEHETIGSRHYHYASLCLKAGQLKLI
jgi:hypothetical protein